VHTLAYGQFSLNVRTSDMKIVIVLYENKNKRIDLKVAKKIVVFVYYKTHRH